MHTTTENRSKILSGGVIRVGFTGQMVIGD